MLCSQAKGQVWWIPSPGELHRFTKGRGAPRPPTHRARDPPTHLQLLASQGCRLILSLRFAAPFGDKGHGAGPEQSEGGQLGLRAHGMELHEILHGRQERGL